MARPTESELRVETDKIQTAYETIYAMFDTNTGNARNDVGELESFQRVLEGLSRDVHAVRSTVIDEIKMIKESRTKVRQDRTDAGNRIGDGAVNGLPDPQP